jgi:hypothetical protein
MPFVHYDTDGTTILGVFESQQLDSNGESLDYPYVKPSDMPPPDAPTDVMADELVLRARDTGEPYRIYIEGDEFKNEVIA